jgi:ribonuclease PH
VLIEMGRTRVLCTVSIEERVPPWLADTGSGWVTAEYAMLPGSSAERISRRSISGGRTKEIQRLIGRSLRAVVDMEAMGELSMLVDCDVLQADGGTRTAAITGAWVALWDAFEHAVAAGLAPGNAITDHCAAVSVGIRGGDLLLDLDYSEDAGAEVDCNVVMTGSGDLIEVQGTAEGDPFSRSQLDGLLDLAASGVTSLIGLQKEAIG